MRFHWGTPVDAFAKERERYEANEERKRSNAAGPHEDRRTRRNRDRGSQRRQAIGEEE